MHNLHDIIYFGFLFGHGGDALQMLELATAMSARGQRVKIVVPELETTVNFAQRCQNRGIEVIRDPRIFSRGIHNCHTLRDQMALLRAHQAPLIHFHTGGVCLPRTTLLAMALLRMPRAYVTVHSPQDDLNGNRIRTLIWTSAVSRLLHNVICPSENSRRLQLRYGVDPNRVTRIYNAVDNARFSKGCGDRARQELGVGPEARLILFCSRLDTQKRPQEALEIFHRIAEEHTDAHLVFVGNGALEPELRRSPTAAAYRARVHFVGYQDNVPDWLAACDVWLLPTETENFSLSILEALAAGCAIVSTHCQGNDEVLVNEVNALTTAVGDLDGMTEAVRRILTNPFLAHSLRASARRTANHYTVDRMADEYANCYGLTIPTATRKLAA